MNLQNVDKTPTTKRAVPENLNIRQAVTLRCIVLLQKLVLSQVVRKSPTYLES